MEAGQIPSGAHGEEALKMEQNDEVQNQEAPERLTGRRRGWANVQNIDQEPRSLVLGVAACVHTQADDIGQLLPFYCHHHHHQIVTGTSYELGHQA